VDPITITVAAALACGVGGLIPRVRELLRSIFRRPSKTSVIVHYGNQSLEVTSDTVDVEELLRGIGLSGEQATRTAQNVSGTLEGRSGAKGSPDA